MHFADFDPDAFLRDHWQKAPLLLRNPWAGWVNPLEPDELAGLACEPAVEARLIVEGRDGPAVEHGPFAETRFATLGGAPWTLLVQGVDAHVPDVAALIAPFRFVPNWRIDDVMVSYATDGGGVGAHYDHYDVFLVQGLGRRRWRVGGLCDESTELRPHDDLRLLARFEPTAEWVLEPGDILYVPPGVAHEGVATGDDCMTYSIGFRAPATGELMAGWCEHLLRTMDEDDRYADPDLLAAANPGEITPAALARLQAMVTERIADGPAFARWFGQHNSAPKHPAVDWRPEHPVGRDTVRQAIAAGRCLRRNPASRFAFVREGDAVVLFVDGVSFDCAQEVAEFAERLCAGDVFPAEPALAASPAALDLLTDLFARGCVAFDDEVGDDEDGACEPG